MKMAPVLMKMAPGAIPRPGRVPEWSFCPPNLDFEAAAARNFSGSLVNIFKVYSAGAIYGQKGSSRRFPRQSRQTLVTKNHFGRSQVRVPGLIEGERGECW